MKKLNILLTVATASLLTSSLISLTSCNKGISTCKVINQSIGVTFTNLPTEVKPKEIFDYSYITDDPAYIVDETRSDILVSGKSIKTITGVAYASGHVIIPANYVTGDITIILITKQDTQTVPVINESDKENINLYDFPAETLKGVEIKASYSINSVDKKLDVLTSIIQIGDKEYRLGKEITYTTNTITIPKDLVRSKVIFRLRATDVVYAIDNQSDKNIVFDNLPKEIKSGATLSTTYTISNDQVLDFRNSDVLSGSESIKIKSGVIIENGILQIPGMFINDNLIIKLVLRDRKTFNITCEKDAHVSDITMPSTFTEGIEISGTYKLETNYELNFELCTIQIVDGVSIKDEPGVILANNKIYIPPKSARGNIKISIVTKVVKIIAEDWTTIVDACNQFETDNNEPAFFEKITINGAHPTSGDDLIGATKTIQLHIKEETTQTYTVRIIGYKHDKFIDADGTTKTAILTFETVNFVSDEDGNYLQTSYYFGDPTIVPGYKLSDDYQILNSDLYKVLNSGEETVKWLKKDSMTEYYCPSCLTLLTKSEPTLAAGIKTTTKQMSAYDIETYKYTLINQTFKLFPLNYTEMKLPFTLEVLEDSQNFYSYWEKNNNNSDRVKGDLNHNIGNYWLATPAIVWDQEQTVHLPYSAWFVGNDGTPHKNTARFFTPITFAFNI